MDNKKREQVLNYYNNVEYINLAAKCAHHIHFDTIKDIQKYIKFNSSWKTLEVGCGKGVLRDAFPNWTGTDISQKALSMVPNEYPTVLAEADKIPLPDSSFDLVIMFDFIEHVANPQEVLIEALRLLRPNGYLIIRSPQLILGKERVFSPLGIFRIFAELFYRLIDEIKKIMRLKISLRVRTQKPDYNIIGEDADAIYLFNPHNLCLHLITFFNTKIINPLTFPNRLGLQYTKDKILIIKKLA